MDTNPRLKAARDLIQARDYDAARTLLEAMPDDPQAQGWLEYLDIAAPETAEKRKNDQFDDPNPDYYYPGKRKLEMDDIRAPKDYMSSALLTLGAYFLLGPLGYIANIYYLYDAHRARTVDGLETQNVGCLWAMLALSLGGVILTMMLVVFVIGVSLSAL